MGKPLQMDAKTLAHKMYNRYGDKADWKAWDGRPMPQWEGVGEIVQSRWEAAAECAIEELLGKAEAQTS